MKFPSVIFVTGTDTGVGKSFVSAILLSGLNGVYWKPIQTGEDLDRIFVKKMTCLGDEHFLKEKYCFTQPLSPHEAAKRDNKEVVFEELRLPTAGSHLIIEGCGGLLVPINEDYFILDLIAAWKIPVLLVARSGLGTINHTLLSLNLLRQKGLEILGVVMNGPKNEANKEAIIHFGKVLAFELEYQNEIAPKKLFSEIFT